MNIPPVGAPSVLHTPPVARPTPPPPAPAVAKDSDGDGDSDRGGVDLKV